MISLFLLYREKPVAFGNLGFLVSVPYASQLATDLKLKSPAFPARLLL
jgi:hypothetical protein